MSDIFRSIKKTKPRKTRFNLSHSVKMTMDFGAITPFFCHPVLPGDKFNMNTEFLLRMAPMTAPIMQKVDIYTRFFYVPNRLLWNKWEEFITGGSDGTATPEYPTITSSSFIQEGGPNGRYSLVGLHSLADYLGFPVKTKADTNSLTFDALPFRAYQLIYNEYFRDQTLQREVPFGFQDSGNPGEILSVTAPYPDDMTQADYEALDGVSVSAAQGRANMALGLRYKSWNKDYFTSALPFPQRGDDVRIPLYGDAKIVDNSTPFRGIGNVYSKVSYAESDRPDEMYSPATILFPPKGSPKADSNLQVLGQTGPYNNLVTEDDSTNGVFDANIIPASNSQYVNYIEDSLGVDLSNASAATINELRRAIKAQEFLEAFARGGSRPIEALYNIFGVRCSDARLQRPEYLGGGKSNIVISDVLQTSQTTDDSPQATPSGHGVGIGRSHSFSRFFEEHGYVIGVMYVVPKAAYMQGLSRLFTKFDRLDYYWPQFDHLGEQEIKNQEIFYNNSDDPRNEGTFGYTPRYAEYKYLPDQIRGDFRASLDFWHMARIFKSLPGLNSKFLTDWTSANRVFAVQHEDDPSNPDIEVQEDRLWLNLQINLIAWRPMSKYGTPYM